MKPPDLTRVPDVEGYTDRLSALPGETVAVRCASRAARFDVRITRVGADRMQVFEQQGIAGTDQTVPERAWAVGCGWDDTFEFEVGHDWPSGFYEIEFMPSGTTDPAAAGHAFIAVRAGRPDPTRPLLVLGTNTYQAYNQWGGRCMYTGAVEVSLDRPLERGYLRRPIAPVEVAYDGRLADTTGHDREHTRLVEYQATHGYPLWTSSAGWHNWERRFVVWAESAGFGVDVATSSDLHRSDEVLAGRRLVLSVGHDEYWSWEMRDHIDAYVDGGGAWAVFSGNTCFWQVRFDAAGRTMTCYKGAARTSDPVDDPTRLSGMWSDPRIGRPENLTTGLSFSRAGYAHVGDATRHAAGGFEIQRPEHWALAGTGLQHGDQLGADSCIVGYEVDGCDLTYADGRFVPTGIDGTPIGLEVIGTAPAHLLSITADRCEAPAAIWASVEPPGDLEGVAEVLFGPDVSPQQVAALGRGRAVVGEFARRWERVRRRHDRLGLRARRRRCRPGRHSKRAAPLPQLTDFSTTHPWLSPLEVLATDHIAVSDTVLLRRAATPRSDRQVMDPFDGTADGATCRNVLYAYREGRVHEPRRREHSRRCRLNQHVDTKCPERLGRLSDRGEARIGDPGERDVIETHHHYVERHTDADVTGARPSS